MGDGCTQPFGPLKNNDILGSNVIYGTKEVTSPIWWGKTVLLLKQWEKVIQRWESMFALMTMNV